MQLKEHIQYNADGILSKVIVKNDNANITLFCMGAGTDISEHTASREGTVYVIEGKGTFMLDGKTIPMQAGTLIHLRKAQPHSLQVEENTSFLLTLYG
jgi:quercetin dioxygenase-like cupin family protein